jgi:hypothetical protein
VAEASAMRGAMVAVISQDLTRLRSFRALLESAALPVVAAVLPESGGLEGLRAYLARHAASVVLYDLVPDADAVPGDDAAARRFFHRVQTHEPARRFVVLARSPHAVLAGAGPTNLAAVLAADSASATVLVAVRRAVAQQRRVAGRASAPRPALPRHTVGA